MTMTGYRVARAKEAVTALRDNPGMILCNEILTTTTTTTEIMSHGLVCTISRYADADIYVCVGGLGGWKYAVVPR